MLLFYMYLYDWICMVGVTYKVVANKMKNNVERVSNTDPVVGGSI